MTSLLLSVAAVPVATTPAPALRKRGHDAAAAVAQTIPASSIAITALAQNSGAIRGLELDASGAAFWADSGDSLLLTLDVATAGSYAVAYSLSSSAPSGGATAVHASLLKGDVQCSAASHEGRLEAPALATADWGAFTAQQATPVQLSAGAGQQYTLCFEKAAYTLISSICIAESC